MYRTRMRPPKESIRVSGLAILAVTFMALVWNLVTAVPAYSDVFYVLTGDVPPFVTVQQEERSIHGAYPPTGPLTGKVAVQEIVASTGVYLPLPMYDDGSQASEDEIFWTVSLESLTLQSFAPMIVTEVSCDFTGRMLSLSVPNGIDASVRVTIVAIQKAAPIPASEASIGEVKAKFK